MRVQALNPPRPRNTFPQSAGIYLISDRRLTGMESLVAKLSAAMRAGVAAVQLRERDLDDTTYTALAQQLVALRQEEVPILLNRRPHLVASCKADGVQIGAEDIAQLPSIRASLPAGALIGVSCHSESDIGAAATQGADFALIGPLFPTRSKPEATAFITPQQVVTWQERYAMPLYPLGGIGLEQAEVLRDVGMGRLACISAILNNEQIEEVGQRVQALKEALGVS